MKQPHEIPATGPAAAFAAQLQAALPRLETERLNLRAPRIEDIDAYAEIICSDRGQHVIENATREEAWQDFIQMVGTWILRGHGVWSVEDKAGALLGFALLGFEPGDHEPELGFIFREVAEGKGFAAEAAKAVRAYAFEKLGFKTLVSTIDHGNIRSASLAERLGAARDGAAEAAHNNEILVYRYPSPEAFS